MWLAHLQTDFGLLARSSAKAEYRAMAHTACEMMWVKFLLQKMGFSCNKPMRMFCDNQTAAMYIPKNPVFHERTKHIEIDCHFIRDLVKRKHIAPVYVRSSYPNLTPLQLLLHRLV